MTITSSMISPFSSREAVYFERPTATLEMSLM